MELNISTSSATTDFGGNNTIKKNKLSSRERSKVVEALYRLRAKLNKNKSTSIAHRIDVRSRARVPIICITTRYGFDSDISMGGQSGADTSDYVTAQVERYESFATVILFLKILLEQVNLDKPFTGGIGSYKLYVLLAYHFEKHLALGGNDTPEEILLSFFFRFGNVGNAYNSNNNTGFDVEALTPITSLSILRSNGGEADLSSAFRIDECVALFGLCFERLMSRLERSNVRVRAGREGCGKSTSFLETIIDANKLDSARTKCITMVEEFEEPPPSGNSTDGEDDDINISAGEGHIEQKQEQTIEKDKTITTATAKVPATCAAVSSLLFQRPSESTSNTATTITTPVTPTRPKTRSIHVKVVSGPHEGSQFHLKPIKRRPCLIGSSSARKFRKHGISLPKDEMVSIKQGQFIMKDQGTPYYIDSGSGEKVLEGGKVVGTDALLLKEGMELTVGSGILKISLVSDGDEEKVVEDVLCC